MNRGNIRMSCNRESINLQFWHTPTIDQWRTIKDILKEAREFGLSIYIEKYYPKKRSICFFEEDEFANWLFRSKNISWNIWGRLIKRDIYQANLDFLMSVDARLIMAEDVLAMFVIYHNCQRLNFISDMLYYYRYNPNSSTNDKSIENLKNCIDSFEVVIAKMREFASKNQCDKRWQKLYISLGVHECDILKRRLKIKEGKFGLMDKIGAFIEGRWFVIRRKLRVKFGV